MPDQVAVNALVTTHLKGMINSITPDIYINSNDVMVYYLLYNTRLYLSFPVKRRIGILAWILSDNIQNRDTEYRTSSLDSSGSSD